MGPSSGIQLADIFARGITRSRTSLVEIEALGIPLLLLARDKPSSHCFVDKLEPVHRHTITESLGHAQNLGDLTGH